MSTPHVITELWVWVSDEPDGSEGIIACTGVVPGYFSPLLNSKENVARALEGFARQCCQLAGRPEPRLKRFSLVETRH